jgi:hypothetical protein
VRDVGTLILTANTLLKLFKGAELVAHSLVLVRVQQEGTLGKVLARAVHPGIAETPGLLQAE